MEPEGTNALHVATMEELSSFYTLLIPKKKVLTKILLGIGIQIWVPSTDTRQKPECTVTTFGSNKAFQNWSLSFSSDNRGCQEIKSSLQIPPKAPGGIEDSFILRWEHRFNFSGLQYQIFFTKTLTHFIKLLRAPQRKSTKLKLNHHYFHRKWIWDLTMYFCACKNG